MGQGVAGKFADERYSWVVAAAVAVVFLLINPVGYIGGGNDDARYLDAARCWAEFSGPCLADRHWGTRWPVITTLTASIATLGESRLAVSLGALPWWIATIALAGWVGSLWFSRRVGLIAAMVLASVPVVANIGLRPNTDLAELTGQLAALGLATVASRRGSRRLAFASGVAAAIAVAARDTSLLFVSLGGVAWFLLAPQKRGLMIWAAAGLLGSVVIEMAGYWLASGDPLFRYKLAMAHGGVPSEYLKPHVDLTKSPILNPEFIGGWVRPLGIELWWPIDGWLNLLPNPMIGPWILAGILAPWLAAQDCLARDKKTLAAMLVGAVLLAGGLVYGLAVDPRPRMFLLAAAAASIGIGWAIDRWLAHRQTFFVIISLSALATLGAWTLLAQTNSRPIEEAAGAWIDLHADNIETDAQTRDTLALVPKARLLPLEGAGRPLRLTLQLGRCHDAIAMATKYRFELVKEARLAGNESLCLLRYVRSEVRKR